MAFSRELENKVNLDASRSIEQSHETNSTKMTSSFTGGSALLRYLSLLAVVVICSTVACAANNTYNIYPACHDDDTECLTLFHIVSDVSRYFVNSTTLVFHHGNHNLPDVDVFVTDVNNLTLKSSNSSNARILGSNSSFSFSNTSALQIESIKFISCRIELHSIDAKLDSCWFENCTADIGGAIAMYNESIVYFTGDTVFVGNSATSKGAAVSSDSSTLVFSGSTTFSNNTSNYDGGAMAVHKSIVTVSGYSSFTSNSAVHRGGAVFIDVQNNVNFYGSSTFVGNIARIGGAVRIVDHNNVSFNGTNLFLKNVASDYGGAVLVFKINVLTFGGYSSFIRNSANSGGALFSEYNNTISCKDNCSFISNYAEWKGGAILSQIHDTFTNFTGSTYLFDNIAQFGGGIYAEDKSYTYIDGSVDISGNVATYGGGIFVQNGKISMNATALFKANMAVNSKYGGAIHAVSSIVSLFGNFTMLENEAGFGGAMAFSGLVKRALIIQEGTHILFKGNTALSKGGAIHIDDSPYTYCLDRNASTINLEPCFFQVEVENCNPVFHHNASTPSYSNRSLSFINNTAYESGDTVYGGNIKYCGVCYPISPLFTPGEQVLQNLTHTSDLSPYDIASDAVRICSCENTVPDCSTNSVTFMRYPGQTLSLDVVAVGQLNGVVPSDIHAESIGVKLPNEFTTQFTTNKTCTPLHYPLQVIGQNMSATLMLYAYEPCYRSGYPLNISVTFLPCPAGFSLSDQGECSCDEQLQQYMHNCLITNQTIVRPKDSLFWVGVDNIENKSLIIHPHCPFDYCRDEEVEFQVNYTDIQCQEGRAGLLCGECKSTYSLALGSSRCIPNCSDKYLSLLFGFIFAGLALVCFLFLSDLTVDKGTISGVIFYANILAINQTVFFPSGHHNILTVFIAWVNLDFGIETCFLKGLDMYTKTWLQFAFPLYIWVLVWLIVRLAKASSFVTKLIAHTNPVAVLATLVLLSYTKLLRAVMISFAFAKLDYPNGEIRTVWLYDGNVGFLDGKHIVLFLFSLLVLLAFFIPYTLLLLCGQWIKWLPLPKQLYLKPFLDAYFAPYRDKHCYWTGLLLLVRFLVLVMSTIINVNTSQDPCTNLLMMLAIVSCLLAWIGYGVYRKRYLHVLEASYLLNLLILMGGTYQVRFLGGNQAALIYTSSGLAFVGLVVTVICAVSHRLPKSRLSALFSYSTIGLLRHPDRRAYNNLQDKTPVSTPVPITIVDETLHEMTSSSDYRESVLVLVSTDSTN